MKHFNQAREDAIAALKQPEIANDIEKTCLIVDLRAKMKVLVKIGDQTRAEAVSGRIERGLSKAADIFWGKEIWVEAGNVRGAKRTLYQAAWSEARPEPPGQEKFFVLDRRLSKDSWLGQGVQPPWPLNEHTPPIISFYSFKGGVGRTTALLALAINLARSGKKSVVIDFDLEAPGAGVSLGPAKEVPTGLGLLEFLIDYQVAPKEAIDISEFYHLCDDRAVIKDGEPICCLPSGELNQWYLEKLARVNYEQLYQTAGKDIPGSPLHSLLKLLREKLNPDVFLIDSRAGLHDMGGLSLSGLAHLRILFGLDSKQSWSGMSLVVAHLGKDMVRSGMSQRDCVMVHSMVSPTGAARDEEIKRFKETSFQVFSENYYDAADSDSGEWPLPDPESVESPHFPVVVSWSERVKGYVSLGSVSEVLCEGEYLDFSKRILDKVDRTL